jgi:hypothetical protein
LDERDCAEHERRPMLGRGGGAPPSFAKCIGLPLTWSRGLSGLVHYSGGPNDGDLREAEGLADNGNIWRGYSSAPGVKDSNVRHHPALDDLYHDVHSA